MRVPIACTLDDTSAHAQLGEWRDVLGPSIAVTERLSPAAVSFRLRADVDGFDAIVRLAQREKACCAFFDFALRIEADRVALDISVPPEAAAALDDFIASTAPPPD